MPDAGPPPSAVLPPPMRIVRDGWLGRRDLTRAEAEAWHLREAVRAADERERRWHSEQAERCHAPGGR